jgi:hypothetical protein
MPEEIAEIERHKYFLSQKHGHDVGWERAEQDWDEHHAAVWRATRQHMTSRPDPAREPAGGGLRRLFSRVFSRL